MARVYVGNLPPNTAERDVSDEFERFGRLRSVWVARKPPGFAFLEYEDPRDADDAVRKLDGYKGWRVEISKNRGPPASRVDRGADRPYSGGRGAPRDSPPRFARRSPSPYSSRMQRRSPSYDRELCRRRSPSPLARGRDRSPIPFRHRSPLDNYRERSLSPVARRPVSPP